MVQLYRHGVELLALHTHRVSLWMQQTRYFLRLGMVLGDVPNGFSLLAWSICFISRRSSFLLSLPSLSASTVLIKAFCNMSRSILSYSYSNQQTVNRQMKNHKRTENQRQIIRRTLQTGVRVYLLVADLPRMRVPAGL